MLDLFLRPAGFDRGVECLDRERRIGGLVLLLDQQPVFIGSGADQRVAAFEADAAERELDLAAAHRLSRRRLLEFERPPIPDHDGTAAVLAFGNRPLEVVVADRMVFDVRRQPALRWVKRRPFGDRPADQHPFHFEAKVVVQPCRPVLLHDEAVAAAWVRHALGLGSLAEIALSLIFGERTRHRIEFARMIRWSPILSGSSWISIRTPKNG